MVDILPVVGPGIVGIVGVLIGVSLNELLRRANRIETYAPKIFEKRLHVYEELLRRMSEGKIIADDVMENAAYSKDERHERISAAIMNIAEFVDANELYLDQEIGPHCVTAYMGAEDVFDAPTEEERQRIKSIIIRGHAEARRMIREDSGVAKIDRMFKRVAKPKIASPVINYLRTAKKRKNKAPPE